MLPYLITRISSTLVLLLLVIAFSFFFIHLLPGDPAQVILGDSASAAAVEKLRADLGLNEPLLNQFSNHIVRLTRLDFGESLISGRPVALDLGLRTTRTLELVIGSTLLAILVGLPLGVLAALMRNTFADQLISNIALIGLSVPAFVRATLLVLFFSLQLKWLPSSGFTPLSEDAWEHIKRLILPCVALAIGNGAIVTRITRTALLEVLNEDYVRTAKAKGVTPQWVTWRHAVRNALIPVVTVVGLQVGAMFGGAVVVEAVFNWPGLSSLLVTAITRRDYPVAQGVILVLAVVYVTINFLVDSAYGLLDPRIRYS